MSAYYNEIDAFCCKWLGELMKRGLIPAGEIDNRSIEDVKPEELKDFIQCHFFAGIGGWPYALRLAGWPNDKPVWTGSCPCQPFSAAGKRKGVADERHLWPAFFWLISQYKPDTIIGEQVASKDALSWIDLVQADLEGAGYAVGAVDTCAAGFGAPHIRQRLYWVALGDTQDCGRFQRELGNEASSQCRAPDPRQNEGRRRNDASDDGGTNWLAHAASEQDRQEQQKPAADEREWEADCVAGCGVFDRVGNNNNTGLERLSGNVGTATGRQEPVRQASCPSDAAGSAMPINGFWANPDWIWCRDKKWRPVKPGLSPLVDGFPAGMGHRRDVRAIRQRLKGYGNAIVIPQAVEFIKALLEII